MAVISRPSIPEVIFERVKTDLTEFAFNFFQDGIALNVSTRTYKIRLKASGVNALDKAHSTNAAGRVTFTINDEDKLTLKDSEYQLFLVEILAGGGEKTLMAGTLRWSVPFGKPTGLVAAPDVSVNYITATQELMVALGVVDFGSSSSAASAAQAEQSAQTALQAENNIVELQTEVSAAQQDVTEKAALSSQNKQDAELAATRAETAAANAEMFGTGSKTASPGDTPAVNTLIYTVSEPGTYANFGGLVVSSGDLAAGLVQLRKTGATWSKVIVPIDLGNYTSKQDFSAVINTTYVLGNSVFTGTSSGASTLSVCYLQQKAVAQHDGILKKVKLGFVLNGGFTSRNIAIVQLRVDTETNKYVELSKTEIAIGNGIQEYDLASYQIQVKTGDVFGVQILQSNTFLQFVTIAGAGYGYITLSLVSGKFEGSIANITGNPLSGNNGTIWMDFSFLSPNIPDLYNEIEKTEASLLSTLDNYSTKADLLYNVSSSNLLGNSVFTGTTSGLSDMTKCYIQQGKTATKAGRLEKIKAHIVLNGGFTSRNVALVQLRRNTELNKYQQVSKTVIAVTSGLHEYNVLSANINLLVGDIFGIQIIEANSFLQFTTGTSANGWGVAALSLSGSIFEGTVADVTGAPLSGNNQNLLLEVTYLSSRLDELTDKIPQLTQATDSIFSSRNIEAGKYINASNYTIATGAGFYGSGYIPVTPGSTIKIKGLLPVLGYKALQYCDASKVKLTSTGGVTLRADIYVGEEFTLVIPAGCFFIYFTTKIPASLGVDNTVIKNITVKVVGSTEYASKISGKGLMADRLAPGAKIGEEPVATTAPKLSLPIFKPNRIFTVCNNLAPTISLRYNRNYAAAMYIDRMIDLGRVDRNIYFKETLTDKFPFYSPVNETGGAVNGGVTVLKTNKFINLTGDIEDTEVVVEHVSTLATVGKSTTPIYHQIGDSNTDGAESSHINIFDDANPAPWRTYEFLKVLFAMDKVDAGNPSADHNILVVGARNPRTLKYTYNGTEIQARVQGEGNSGWSTFTYLYHADLREASQGVWDLLGLGDGSGTDYTGTDAQKTSIYSTREGVNTPKDTPAFITYMNTTYPGNGITTYVAALVKATALLADPVNKYFDKDKSGAYAFSLAKYLERYKTLANDGVTRLVAGTTAGSKVTNVNAFDMCLPTIIGIMLGTNDRSRISAAMFLANIQAMIADIRSVSSTITVMFHMPDSTGTYFPGRYPEFNEMSTLDALTHTKAIEFNTQLLTLDSDANKLFFVPGYFTQPTAYGTPVREVFEASSLGKTFGSTVPDKLKFWVRHTNAPMLHLNNNANAAIAYQLYGVIKYSLSL